MTLKAKIAKNTVISLMTLGVQRVKSVGHYKDLGFVWDIDLSDDKDIQTQLRYQNCHWGQWLKWHLRPSLPVPVFLMKYSVLCRVKNKLNWTISKAYFSRCSNAEKNLLFRSFCTPMYASQLWCDFRKAYFHRLFGACNFGCRALYNMPWRASINSHQVQYNIPTFEIKCVPVPRMMQKV